jgi:Ca-activated chloride channel family protein
VVAVLCAVAGDGRAQAVATSIDESVRLERTLVTLDVTVQDRYGRFVSGLAPRRFTVYEDKVEQEVAFFREEDAPVTLGIVCDLSGSMKSKMLRAATALRHFVETCHEEDEFFLVGFNDRVELIRDLTPDPSVTSALTLVDPGGRTALYDAAVLGMEKAREGRHRKRALLIVSDGQDNSSRYTLKELREIARESDVILYGLGIIDPEEALSPYGASVLEDLCRASGGMAYFPTSTEGLVAACTRVALELRHQYSIGYYPSSATGDGEWRKIKVTLEPPADMSRLVLRTREGYYGPRALAGR